MLLEVCETRLAKHRNPYEKEEGEDKEETRNNIETIYWIISKRFFVGVWHSKNDENDVIFFLYMFLLELVKSVFECIVDRLDVEWGVVRRDI